ncbi:MAG: hypothetical protein AB7E95_02545 [Kiritimatiellales bacterium]
MKHQFTEWTLWENRSKLPGMHYPGIYVIAISLTNISSEQFSMIPEIAYFGMTNSKGGLQSRLKAFDNTLKGKNGHGGAHRFRFKYPDYSSLTSSLYVAICPFSCDVNSHQPNDLKIMGEVAKFEYVCFASFVEKFGSLPEFNDMQRSPKK